MASRKCWSRTLGAKRGTRVRVYERSPGSTLYCAVWVAGKGVRRASLKHDDKARALQQAMELACARSNGEKPVVMRKPVTLGALCARYLAENRHSRDGCLKAEKYRRECEGISRYLCGFFGANCTSDTITPDRISQYARARRAGLVNGRKVRTRSIQRDLVFLKSVFGWALGVYENGAFLLDRNPLAGYRIPRENDPKRPVIPVEIFSKLLEKSDEVNPRLRLLLVLMESTGRRLGSVLGLRWDDLDFEKREIRWRAELDKRRRTWVTPMPAVATDALVAERKKNPAIGAGLLFPSRKNPSRQITAHLASYWLKRAFEIGNLQEPAGTLWHGFRRKWATERRHFPLKDVTTAGGWSDVQTMITCYQRPDAEMMRAVVDLGALPAPGRPLAQRAGE
jgi:integrase